MNFIVNDYTFEIIKKFKQDLRISVSISSMLGSSELFGAGFG
jgi:hypothetical protein